MGRYWAQTGRGIVPVAVVLTGLGLWAERFLPEGWTSLIVGGLTYAAIYCLITHWLAVNQEERAFISRFLGRLRVWEGHRG